MASSTKRPWHMFYPLAGMLLICAVWSGYWFIAFSGARELVAARRLHLAHNGAQLICSREGWSGFPFRFEFSCEDPSLQIIQAGDTYRLTSENLLAVAQAYNPLHILLLVIGPTSIESTKTGVQTLTHDQALISVTLNLAGEFDVSSEAANVDMPGLFSAAQVRVFARKTDKALDLAANAEQLVLLSLQDSPTSLSRAEFVTRSDASFLNQSFEAPSKGRPLDIRSLKISQGTVDFSATGSVFLDPQRRLAGKLSSETNDLDRLMKIISPIFSINEEDSAAIRNLISLTGSDPATKTTKADFVANEGVLYWGLFKLADLAPLY